MTTGRLTGKNYYYGCGNYLHELPEIKLGSLEYLHLADEDILKWEYAGGGLLNFFTNNFWNEL